MCLAFMRKAGVWDSGGRREEKLLTGAGVGSCCKPGKVFQSETKEPTPAPPSRSHIQGQQTDN